jgi:hypothetical protein
MNKRTKRKIVIPADKLGDFEIHSSLLLSDEEYQQFQKLLANPGLRARLKVFIVEGSDMGARMQLEPTAEDKMLLKWGNIFRQHEKPEIEDVNVMDESFATSMKKIQYLFSDFRLDEFEALHQELSQIFALSKNDLSALYKLMREEFELEGYPKHTLNRKIFCSYDDNFQQKYDEALVIGVDIPSIFELADRVSNKKNVVILGQDPLRRSNQRVEEIEVGTPYGLHLKNCRELLPNTRLYFDLIKVLLTEGYRVYLTDVFKIWVSQSDSDHQGIGFSQIDRDRFIKLLSAELEIFNPLAVITWGRVAGNTVKALNLKTEHFEFLHPSGAANGAWQKLIGQPTTRENKIDFWRQTILKYLKELH